LAADDVLDNRGRKPRLGQAHHPTDRKEQPEARDQRDGVPDAPGRTLPVFGKALDIVLISI
jgi:hypothetical protein